MLNDTLKKIVDEIPGASGAIIMGFDGIAIDQYKAKGAEDTDLDTIVTEFSFRFGDLRNAAESLEMGNVSDITVKMDSGTILFRGINEEFFAVVLLADSGHFGKGRWKLRSYATELAADL